MYFVNYPEDEIERRVMQYRDLSLRAMSLMRRIPERLKDAYFELQLYPVKGASMLNEYQLLSRRSMARAAAGSETSAMKDAMGARRAYQELNNWTRRYNEDIQHGKWACFFDWHPYHWYKSTVMDAPVCTSDLLDTIKKS